MTSCLRLGQCVPHIISVDVRRIIRLHSHHRQQEHRHDEAIRQCLEKPGKTTLEFPILSLSDRDKFETNARIFISFSPIVSVNPEEVLCVHSSLGFYQSQARTGRDGMEYVSKVTEHAMRVLDEKTRNFCNVPHTAEVPGAVFDCRDDRNEQSYSSAGVGSR